MMTIHSEQALNASFQARGARSASTVIAMNCPRLYATAPPRKASVTRKSGDASSIPISVDEWKNVRTIVPTKTRITSTASMTLSRPMTALSIALIHPGTLGA